MGFDVERVTGEVAGKRFAGRIRHFAVTGSTSTLAMEAATAGEDEGVWVADEQTEGRGRGGHAWHSEAGEGLYVSILVRPELRMETATVLPLAVGLAARAAVLDVTGLVADLRWPNDLLLGGQLVDGRRRGGRKFGGILVETSGGAAGTAARGAPERGQIRFAVIGVGLNVNHRKFPEELAGMATSLRMEGGLEVRREDLLIALLRQVEDELSGVADEGGVKRILERFGEASSWVKGKRVRVGTDGYTGVTLGLTAEGFLRVLGEDGVERTVMSGGVREKEGDLN